MTRYSFSSLLEIVINSFIPMNINDILQIILIPLFISLTAAALFELFRHRRKDIQITCRTLSIRHYKEKESGDVSISLSYKNEKVGDSIVVATVMLVNTGRKDISFKHVFEDRIQIGFKDARIIDIIIQEESNNVASRVEKDREKDVDNWFLSWGILKRKEKIILRIVAVCHNTENSPIINNVSKDLSFVFRGDNIDGFDFAAPFHIRAFRNGLLVISAILIAIPFFVPMYSTVKYDVKIDGVTYKNVDLHYNAYTQEYLLYEKGIFVKRTKQIDSVIIPQQTKIPEDLITVCILIVLYLIILFLFYRLFSRDRRQRFVKIVTRLFFPFARRY